MFDKNEQLRKFTAKTKVAEMIISTLFLLTGIYLAINTGNKGTWLWIKIGIIALTIPMAIIAFKKERKPLALLSLMCLVYAYGISETKSAMFKKELNAANEFANVPADMLGTTIYERKCMSCHGTDGRLSLSGAKDLSSTSKSPEELKEVIINGKNSMPAFKDILSDEEIDAVNGYIATLKK